MGKEVNVRPKGEGQILKRAKYPYFAMCNARPHFWFNLSGKKSFVSIF